MDTNTSKSVDDVGSDEPAERKDAQDHIARDVQQPLPGAESANMSANQT